ncbi:ABC transporter G family member 31, partial [Hondaea fermentalgiana]
DLPIINGVSGSFEAGKSTLVLGPPGCGVTTLFKILSGRAKVGGPRKLSGDIFYSGFRPEDLHVRKLSTYVDQNDNHIPVLTVRETLQFAYNCFGGPDSAQKAIDKVGISPEASDEDVQRVRDEFENFPDFVIRNLALSNAADTIVGNDLLRGVSGGEKKRVTSAEMMMARRPLAFYDQISTGLDSSATFDICRRITGVAKRLDLTPVCALLQPPPETYALFDEIMVLALGYVVYHGPRENVLPYFESIGFTCPEEMDVADFIQEVTTPDRQFYQTRPDAPADEKAMADAWAESPFSERQRTAMERYCNPDNVIDSDMRR